MSYKMTNFQSIKLESTISHQALFVKSGIYVKPILEVGNH